MNAAEIQGGRTLRADDAGRLAERIAGLIRQGGPLPFDRFMALALYEPGLGYYEREAGTIGREGDFFTSVSVGSCFGEMLAFRFAGWLEELEAGTVWLIEAGAHDGRLMADILAWLDRWRPRLGSRLACGILEPSPRRRAWQQARLEPCRDRIRWFASFGELAHEAPRGILFANELLDALPVRRFEWRAKAGGWQESSVGLAPVGTGDTAGPAFRWEHRPMPSGAGSADRWLRRQLDLARDLAPALPDGFVWEHGAFAIEWWRQAADCMREGWLLTLDYGELEGGAFLPERPQGTLRAFAGHRQTPDLLNAPGTRDLTADVDFALIRQSGEDAGWTTAAYTTQGRFLTEIAAEMTMSLEAVPRLDAGRRRQLLTLVHPEHLGQRFKVLVQHRPETAHHD